MFHNNCLFEYFELLINERKFPIKCPQENCNLEIVLQDLVEILDKNLMDKFYGYTLNKYIDDNLQEVNF